MDSIWKEIGINIQHVCETPVPGRFQLICDRKWLQDLEKHGKISTFPICSQLDRIAHPTGSLEHPWTRINIQVYRKQSNLKVFPLQQQTTELSSNDNFSYNDSVPLTYSQAVSYVTNTNYKNLWEASYKRYHSAHVKFCKQNGWQRMQQNSPNCNLIPHDVEIREIVQRIFQCPLIHCKLDRLRDSAAEGYNDANDCNNFKGSECHANILPAIAAIETSAHISIFFYPPAIVTNLYDCITYSPSVLNKSYNKSLFLVYQIFQLTKYLQSVGLFLGDVRLHDMLINENLWIQLVPRLDTNILHQNIEDAAAAATSPSETAAAMNGGADAEASVTTNEDDEEGDDTEYSGSAKFDLKFAYDLDQFSLREYCEMWCYGQLSNYDYLCILNNAAGRSLLNPAYHHIMPWVTDFKSRNGANWRDLTKSKYRLNKGDLHLDLMFSHGSSSHHTATACGIGSTAQGLSGAHSGNHEVAHHVSDFLSEITYFVYAARRTPQHILREHVRPIWVPAEYPVSIQRLQEWTPDECIPEFYSDPMIFKSIHEDLPDLELPSWATCPEDFICKHREALESQYVSERLQHWIDLNFGYKLTGKAAIKAKNVCLTMVDQHKNLCQRGIVQLFAQPHPPKRFPSCWFNKQAPRLNQPSNAAQKSPNTPHKLTSSESKQLAKSTENLTTEKPIDPMQTSRTTSTPRTSPRMSFRAPSNGTSNSTFYQTSKMIDLPKEYNPITMLQSLETMQSFFGRTFPKQKPNGNALEKIVNSDLMFEENSEDHSFTNQLFVDAATATELSNLLAQDKQKSKNLLAPPCSTNQKLKKRILKNILREKYERDLQVIGCIIVELFAMQRLRPLLMNGINCSFEERLQACRTIVEMYKQDIPKCLRLTVNTLLLQSHEIITAQGLPPTTATQILEPIFANMLIPFPNNYYPTYALIRSLHSFNIDSTLLELHTHFNCNGKSCAKFTEIDRKRVLFERKIAECKVMSCCAHIGRLLEPVAYEQFASIELVLPHIIDLLTTEQTSILAAWNLFDPVAQALGIASTQKYLLQPLMKLYDVESFERSITAVRTRSIDSSGNPAGQLRFSTSSSFKSRKSVKLYHHSFLLRLIVRFGLRCFLHNFIAPLIEAAGGYKEPEDGNGFHYHSSTAGERNSRRTSKNLNYIVSEEENSLTLISPEINDAELEDTTLSVDAPGTNLKQDIEDVFSFDDDVNSDRISASTAENKSIDSFDMRPVPAEEAKEDYNHTETTPAKLTLSDMIFGSKLSNASFEDADKVSLKSQTISDSPTNQSACLGPKSPTIEIPATAFHRSYQLNTIDCDIGSRKSVDSFEIFQQAAEEEEQQKKQMEAKHNESPKSSDAIEIESEDNCDSLQASVISKMSEAKALQNNRISEMSAESLVWLSHRLGPVLTARYITSNLLRMLSLCYVGQENLLPETNAQHEEHNLNYFSIADARVVGDRSAVRVLECLMSIAALFGEHIILLQYFPHISELIALSTKRITGSLEGAIISTLQLLKYIIPCLMDATIMDRLKDTILDAIILPIIRLLGSTRILMPSGYLGRSVLARKLLDAIYALCVRIGPDMSKEYLCSTALRPFFLIFDKAYGVLDQFKATMNSQSSVVITVTPPSSLLGEMNFEAYIRENEEISDVFSPALAHTAYLAFLRFLGEAIMQHTLLNLEFILTLCHEFEQPHYKLAPLSSEANDVSDGDSNKATDAIDFPSKNNIQLDELKCETAANSFGTHVIGNRIEVANNPTTQTKQEIGPMEVLDMVAYKFEHIPTNRHLKGNWLAYWRHEISRPDKDSTLSLKQIKLQSFAGHTNSVRAIISLDNENSFISASKDKTVKLWSLRSEGDGKKTTSCQFTYTAHKKSIHSLSFLEGMRYVVSCDSGVHIWDPFIGRPLGILDAPKHNPVTVVKCLPAPSPLIIAGTNESTLKIIDSRCMQYVNEWRVIPSSPAGNATVRCLAVAPSGNWVAVGLSSGSIVMLDTRTGFILNSWRPMECDVLQLTAPNDQQLVSSSLDHSLAVWHASDGILHYQLKPPPEPAHFLQTIGSELIFATTGNRIGLYSDISSSHAHYYVNKLRSETFRGVLTSLAVLPLNRTFLAGNESGNIVLLC